MNATMKDHAREQAEAQLKSIQEMIEALNTKNDEEREQAEQTIQEDPLEVAVRSDWHTPGEKAEKPSQYKILLCTGGPAVRIVGDLSEYGEPESATLEYQDWGTPWMEYRLDREEEETVLAYARCFYFGE